MPAATNPPEYQPTTHDAIVVGGGVAGSALAYALAEDGRKVLLLERDLSEPDRIVGELMQPGGCLALEKLGLSDTLDGIDGINVHGYVILDKNETCHLEYPLIKGPSPSATRPARGRSFHYGRFVMKLRSKCQQHPNVTVVEAAATGLVRDLHENRVLGVHAIQRPSKDEEVHLECHAPLTFVADGAFSKFRKDILNTTMQAPSHFVGLILHDVVLPMPNHGHVVLADPSPILLYQIGSHDTRILVDVPGSSYPSNTNGALVEHLRNHVAPQLPESGRVRAALLEALETQRPRVMPNPYLPPSKQGHVPGLVMVGDAHNMRHPLTGGGMTVALNDVVILRNVLNKRDFPDFATASDKQVRRALKTWYWERKRLSSVINILANALYALFSAGQNPTMQVLRRSCFEYLRLGGECTAAPVRLLACIAPQPMLLVRHFFAVAVYGTWTTFKRERIWWFPRTVYRNFATLATACRVILPLCWYELRGAPKAALAYLAKAD
ncbi:Squalene epoxidase [Allomyces arbusculus]|nr:Squalene epoxidase [Allomyces arbusculus]